ncbi:hypothetical protein JTB14_014711 [Gonioctena quinquepunctata]|nr:hypothetical protein JTB14_014711 [Gonioctena quinquepunctata]
MNTWWNEDCSTAIKACNIALKTYKRTRNEEDKINFKRHRAQVRLITKRSKRESWRKYVQSINNNTPLSSVWKKVKNISRIETYSAINAIQKNDTIITRKEDIAEELAEHYKHNSTNANYDESFLTHKVAQESIPIVIENNQDPINKPITESEFS